MPKGVKVAVSGQHVKVEGPKGTLERDLLPLIEVKMNDDELSFSRKAESKGSKGGSRP